MSISKNMAARRRATQSFDLISKDIAGADIEERFWEELAKMICSQLSEDVTLAKREEPVLPMSEQEAQAFEGRVFPFGHHRGEYVINISPSYLARLCDPSPFMDELKGYVKSRRFIEYLEATED